MTAGGGWERSVHISSDPLRCLASAAAANNNHLLCVCCVTAEPRVVVVNPGRLAKGNSGGTYARITVAEGSGSIADRARVDIVRV